MSSDIAWLVYLGMGIFYTIFVFWLSVTRNEVRIFSKQNAKPRSTIIVVHLLFLAMILSFMQLIPQIKASLPEWVTHTYGRTSIFSGVVVAAIFILRYIERRYIYAEAETES